MDVPNGQGVWGCQASCFNKYSYMGDTFQGLFVYSMERSSSGELDLMSMVARRIWLRRNAVVFEKRFDHPNVVCVGVISTLDNFTRCNSKRKRILLHKDPIFNNNPNQLHGVPLRMG